MVLKVYRDIGFNSFMHVLLATVIVQKLIIFYSLLSLEIIRSAIHGRGLFCKRNIEAGEMVIEYSGIVIRSVLTDKREKYYDGKVRDLKLHSHFLHQTC